MGTRLGLSLDSFSGSQHGNEAIGLKLLLQSKLITLGGSLQMKRYVPSNACYYCSNSAHCCAEEMCRLWASRHHWWCSTGAPTHHCADHHILCVHWIAASGLLIIAGGAVLEPPRIAVQITISFVFLRFGNSLLGSYNTTFLVW